MRTRPIRTALIALLACAAGCRDTKKSTTTATLTKPSADPFAAAVKGIAFSDNQTLPDYRRTLEALNSELATNEAAAAPLRLPAERDGQLAALLPGLTAEDWAEVKSPTFTKLDSSYYIDTLMLRDGVRSLDLADLAPADKAQAIVDWACRQIYIRPAVLRNQPIPPMPPSFVLRRGFGTSLERATVVLRACQLAGLNACLFGPPGSESRPWNAAADLAAGPFWAIGIADGADVIVYHAMTGTRLNGADGKAIPWAAFQAKPESVANAAALNLPADAAKSIPIVAVPLSAIAERWRVFQAKLDNGVTLFVDPVALRAAFGPAAKAWCPPNDPFDLLRGFATVTPKTDGGRDGGAQPLAGLNQAVQVPASIYQVPAELTNQSARQFLIGRLTGDYATAFIELPSPRERIARGQFFDVTKDLVEKENRYSQAAQRFETQQTTVGDIRTFLAKLNDVYFALESARQKNDAGRVASATADLETLLKENGRTMQLLFDGLLGEISAAEATYLLAINKQEFAARAQLRAAKARKAADEAARVPMADPKKVATLQAAAENVARQAGDAWAAARDWWDRYERYRLTHDAVFPGRADHAKKLADLAKSAGG
jgi:hypothetical protein